MIVDFSFSNFLSYKDETNISYEATKSLNLSEHLIVEDKYRLLKGLIAFGPNASGKSNLIKAIEDSRELFLNGFNMFLHEPFKINNSDNISCFKYRFLINNEIYSYEYRVDMINKIIIFEQLSSSKKRGLYFKKEYIDNSFKISYDSNLVSKDDKNFLKVYIIDYFENKDNHFNQVFFLKDIATRRSDESEYFKIYKEIYMSIKKMIFIYPETGFNIFTIINETTDFSNFKKLLSDYGLDITDFAEEKVDLSIFIPNHSDKIDDGIIKLIEKMDKGDTRQIVNYKGDLCSIRKNDTGEVSVYKLTMLHGSSDKFSYDDESRGTQRLFDLLPLFLMDLNGDSPLILIDEIDSSLHTFITKKLINDLFTNNALENAQFLITSHDINLLNLKLIRADEVLLLEKTSNHSSKIKKLSDYKPRVDREIINSYLSGSFGSIPKIK